MKSEKEVLTKCLEVIETLESQIEPSFTHMFDCPADTETEDDFEVCPVCALRSYIRHRVCEIARVKQFLENEWNIKIPDTCTIHFETHNSLNYAIVVWPSWETTVVWVETDRLTLIRRDNEPTH